MLDSGPGDLVPCPACGHVTPALGTNLIAVGNGVGLCSTNAAQDHDAAKDNGSHASTPAGSPPRVSSNKRVHGIAVGKEFLKRAHRDQAYPACL
jgi:hypothetical protein